MTTPIISYINIDENPGYVEFICGICKKRVVPYLADQYCDFCNQVQDWEAILKQDCFEMMDSSIRLKGTAFTEYIKASQNDRQAFIRRLNIRER
jgi:hypothetical protein